MRDGKILGICQGPCIGPSESLDVGDAKAGNNKHDDMMTIKTNFGFILRFVGLARVLAHYIPPRCPEPDLK